MGNCVFKGSGGVADEKVIKVVTPNGGVMELQAPITAATITNEFPGYAIFLTSDDLNNNNHNRNPPLLHHEHLSAGHSYQLLPLGQQPHDITTDHDQTLVLDMPYRMSVDNEGTSKMRQSSHLPPPPPPDHHDQSSRYNTTTTRSSRGVWKVRLAINSDQLSDILSQDARTEALIESVRTVAKCASGIPSPVNSEHRSEWTTEISSIDQEIYQLPTT